MLRRSKGKQGEARRRLRGRFARRAREGKLALGAPSLTVDFSTILLPFPLLCGTLQRCRCGRTAAAKAPSGAAAFFCSVEAKSAELKSSKQQQCNCCSKAAKHCCASWKAAAGGLGLCGACCTGRSACKGCGRAPRQPTPWQLGMTLNLSQPPTMNLTLVRPLDRADHSPSSL